MHMPTFIVLVLVTLFFPIVFIIYKWAKTLKNDQEKEENKLEDRLSDKKKHEQFEKERAAQLQRVKPMLKMISERLDNESILREDNIGYVIDFDMDALFNSIDEDSNGIISYSELDNAMQLTGEELEIFIRLMNEAAGELPNSREVRRKVFVENFFNVIDDVGNLTPTEEDAYFLFHEIAGGGHSTSITLEELDARLAMFLSDKQILTVNRLFQQKLGITTSSAHVTKPPTQEVKEEIEIGIASDELRPIVRRESIMSIIHTSMTGNGVTIKQTVKGKISKHDFTTLYPSILKEALAAEATQCQPFDIQFKDLSLHVKANGKSLPVVDNVTGRIHNRTMTAIMGKDWRNKSNKCFD